MNGNREPPTWKEWDEMAKCERMSLEEAAFRLGMTTQMVRVQMKNGLLDIGLALPCFNKRGKVTRHQFYIYRPLVEKFLREGATRYGDHEGHGRD